jgi:tetratricopeptide (TPR) repeat protein
MGLAADFDDSTIHDLDKEHHNILRAAQFGLELPETRRVSIDLMLQIFTLIERRGYWRQWIPVMEFALLKCGSVDDALRMSLLDRLGQCYRLDRRWAEAIAAHKEGESVAYNLGNEKGLAQSHLSLSQVYWGARDYDLCEKYGEAALAEFHAMAEVDPELIGAGNTIMGLLYYGRGDHMKAEKSLNRAVSIYRQMQQPALLGRSLMNLALSLEASGNAHDALTLYEEALAVLEKTEHELDKVRVELSLGTLHINAGRLHEAEAAFKRADSTYLRNSGLVYYQALTANNLGNTYLEMGRLPEAELYLRQSIAMWQFVGGRLMLANTIGTLAEVVAAQGNGEDALPLYDEATSITIDFSEDAWGRRLHEKFVAAREDIMCKVVLAG